MRRSPLWYREEGRGGSGRVKGPGWSRSRGRPVRRSPLWYREAGRGGSGRVIGPGWSRSRGRPVRRSPLWYREEGRGGSGMEPEPGPAGETVSPVVQRGGERGVRAGQGGVGWSGAGYGSTAQYRLQDRTGQGKAGQEGAGGGRTGQSWAGQGRTGLSGGRYRTDRDWSRARAGR